jgi:hypothetical protein
VAGGKKSAGKSKKNWVGCLEEDFSQANIPYGSWKKSAFILMIFGELEHLNNTF